jgi:hypothetical protein
LALLRSKTDDYRLQVALLSAMQRFPMSFLLQNFVLITEYLFSDDNEVREAASNIFTVRQKEFNARMLTTTTHTLSLCHCHSLIPVLQSHL